MFSFSEYKKIIIVTALLLIILFFGFFLALGLSRSVSLMIGIGLPEGDIIDNETLLALLSLLVIFGGLLAYIFKQLIRNELKEEIRQETRELLKELSEKVETERAVSIAENYVGQSNILAKLYDSTIAERKSFLLDAWHLDKKGFEAVKLLKSKGLVENYGRIILRAKNSYLCGLIEQQEQRKKNGLAVDQAVRDETLRLKDEIWELVVSGEAEKYDSDIYHFKETCAWAIYFFAESNEEKEKAHTIIRGLEGNSPNEWHESIKLKYEID